MATINHERKKVIINAIRFREDSKRRPHVFNIGKLNETLAKKTERSRLAARSEDRSNKEKDCEPLLVQGTAADGSNK
jgi:hypothetical protein